MTSPVPSSFQAIHAVVPRIAREQRPARSKRLTFSEDKTMKILTVWFTWLFLTIQISSAAVGMGYLYCDSNLNGVADPADTPVPSALGVFINSSGTFSNANWTTAEGFFIVALPDEPDTYTVTIHPLTLPPGTTQVSPMSHTFEITSGDQRIRRDFLISNPRCDLITPGVHYVDANSPSPTPPYTSWQTAARNIQDAIDMANPGSIVYVTNGVYGVGGKVVHGTLLNRVALTKAIRVTSMNGPEVTTILGQNGASEPARCAYLADGTTLSGFTLTGGQTIPMADYSEDEDGAGAWSESYNSFLTNCIFRNNRAYGWGGGSFRGELKACKVLQNKADLYGGGVYESWVENCQIVGNEAQLGGGAYSATLLDSLIASNRVADFTGHGGGASYSILARCTVLGNHAETELGGGGVAHSFVEDTTLESNSSTAAGGGAYGGTLDRCKLIKNLAVEGGGAYDTEVFNSLLLTNSATRGGAVYRGVMSSSTAIGNKASASGGGAFETPVTNSIVWHNIAPQGANYMAGAFHYSITTPLPSGGNGNLALSPAFLSSTDFRLKPASPGVNSGDNIAAFSANDINGNSRFIGRVDIGAYENQDAVSAPFLNWLQQFGLATDGSQTYTDSDADGQSTWHEWIAGTVPTDKDSVLALLAPARTAQGLTLSWKSLPGKVYFIERATHSTGPFETIQSGISGQAGVTSITDANTATHAHLFYRVGIEP